MILETEIRKVFNQLVQTDLAQIKVGGIDVLIRVFDNASKISLSTPVYTGGNFIPKSVRNCLLQKSPFRSNLIKTSLSVDEGKFEIFLNYLGLLNTLNNESFKELLEEFSWLADEWRLFLDEHDKHDLVYVHVK